MARDRERHRRRATGHHHFCPLCNSGIAVDRRLDNRVLDFGTSGKLLHSALVMKQFSMGGEYVNNLGEEGEDRVRASYGANYERLVALKNKYDPTNFFRLNANITPTV